MVVTTFIVACLTALVGTWWAIVSTERDLQEQDMLEDIDDAEWWS